MQTFLVGGPFNGKQTNLDETTAVLKLPYPFNAWTAEGHEHYALGDKGANGFRYHVGSFDLQGWPIDRTPIITQEPSQINMPNYRRKQGIDNRS